MAESKERYSVVLCENGEVSAVYANGTDFAEIDKIRESFSNHPKFSDDKRFSVKTVRHYTTEETKNILPSLAPRTKSRLLDFISHANMTDEQKAELRESLKSLGI